MLIIFRSLTKKWVIYGVLRRKVKEIKMCKSINFLKTIYNFFPLLNGKTKLICFYNIFSTSFLKFLQIFGMKYTWVFEEGLRKYNQNFLNTNDIIKFITIEKKKFAPFHACRLESSGINFCDKKSNENRSMSFALLK